MITRSGRNRMRRLQKTKSESVVRITVVLAL